MTSYQQVGLAPNDHEQYSQNVPPPFPPRPQQQDQSFHTLQQAFPNIHQSVIQAQLAANSFQVEPAFNSLLRISDPNAQSPPPQLPHQTNSHHDVNPNFQPSLQQTPSYQDSVNQNHLHLHPSQGSNYGSVSPSLPPVASPGGSQPYSQHSHAYSGSDQPFHQQSNFYHGNQILPSQPSFQQSHSYYGDQVPVSPGPQIQNLSITPSRDRSLSQSQSQPLFQSQPMRRRIRHRNNCDGCGAAPIRGIRYRCLQCPQEDLCSKCFDVGILNSHKFEVQEQGLERHNPVYCDGCNVKDRYIEGPRYRCKVHHDEDFCETCMQTGKACQGPFEIIKATLEGKQIEQYGCVPMPQEWISLLQPSTGYTYNQTSIISTPGTTWLDEPEDLSYGTVSGRDQGWGRKPSLLYRFNFEKSKGHVISNHKSTWTLQKISDDTKLWTYTIESDRKTSNIKIESLTAFKGKSVPVEFTHGPNFDVLKFTNPTDNKSYRWQTNHPISTIYPSRWDTQRYALFGTNSHSNQESIVADFTWWDGHIDMPEDVLTIRTETLDHSLIIATFNVLIDRQRIVLREEKLRDPDGVAKTERISRLTATGRTTYWRAADLGVTAQTASSKNGAKKSSRITNKNVNNALAVAKAGLSIANAAAGMNTAMAGGGGGDASGGGGGGGGDGGGGGGGGDGGGGGCF